MSRYNIKDEEYFQAEILFTKYGLRSFLFIEQLPNRNLDLFKTIKILHEQYHCSFVEKNSKKFIEYCITQNSLDSIKYFIEECNYKLGKYVENDIVEMCAKYDNGDILGYLIDKILIDDHLNLIYKCIAHDSFKVTKLLLDDYNPTIKDKDSLEILKKISNKLGNIYITYYLKYYIDNL